VGGCIVEWDKIDTFVLEHPAVDAWVNIDSVEKIGETALSLISSTEEKKSLLPVKCGKEYIYDEKTPRLQLTPPHYAYLKIADGCDNCCSYCMIPSIRGNLRSRTLESVISEAKNLIQCGVKELIVIAQDTSAFGRDRNNGRPLLTELLRRLDELPGKFLIRLMYLHPASVDDTLLQEMDQCKHLIRCIEMPIQHISDHILQSMHRKISE